ncbi:MAG: hypothetical protein M3328_04020, partial [Chloroflexota bacterium]|nr:hypothetical protein [Chloroflexota bacterium]
MKKASKRVRHARRWIFIMVMLSGILPAVAFVGARPGVAAPAMQAVADTITVADGPASQVWGRIAGSTVVYDECTNKGCRVMAVDVSKPGSKVTAVSPANAPAYMPSTDGKTVVWVDGRKAGKNAGLYEATNNLNIMGADLATGKVFTVTTAAKSQIYPDVSGDIVVWADFRNSKSATDLASGDIYMYNIRTGKETLVTRAAGLQTGPVTNGKVIVWADYRNEPKPDGFNSNIYGYDIATKKEFVITKEPSTQLYPAISGNTVVWADWRNGEGDIFGYDMATKKEFLVTDSPGSQIMPSISGNLVVWSDWRNEPDTTSGTNVDVYGASLETGREFPMFEGEGAQGAPRISGNTVVWEDNPSGDFKNGDWNITGAIIDPDVEVEPVPTEEAQDEPTPVPTVVNQPSGAPEAGVIKGTVTDTRGKPLADVPITITGTSNAGERANFDTRTGPDGRYSLHVPDGIYRIYGYHMMQYKGRTYRLPVWPVDNIDGKSHYSGDGVVKDFMWKIQGPSPFAKDSPNTAIYYYGGYASLGDLYHFEMMHGEAPWHSYEFPAGSTIELTLKPDGPLFDGSTGRPIVFQIPPEQLDDWNLWDIPLGDYKASAQLIEKNGKKTP